MAKEWYLTSPTNYFSGYENDEFSQNATAAFDELLDNSPETYSVIVNGSTTKKVIIQFKEEKERYLISRIDDIQLGDLVKHKNFDWLVVNNPDDNKMNLTTVMKLCNSTYPIKSNKTRVLKRDVQGNIVLDKFGDPVPILTVTVVNVPCVVENFFPQVDENRQQILLPQGSLRITLQYQDVDDIKVNHTFKMYQNTYQIRSVDYTKVINNKGVVTLNVEEVSNKAVK